MYINGLKRRAASRSSIAVEASNEKLVSSEQKGARLLLLARRAIIIITKAHADTWCRDEDFLHASLCYLITTTTTTPIMIIIINDNSKPLFVSLFYLLLMGWSVHRCIELLLALCAITSFMFTSNSTGASVVKRRLRKVAREDSPFAVFIFRSWHEHAQ